MKKILKAIPFFILSAFIMMALAACAGSPASSSASSAASAEPSSNASSAEEQTTQPLISSNAVVVYYSASGNTEQVADEIAAATDAATFQITPVEPYTEDDLDWTTDGSRVNREHEDESLRNIPLTTTEVPDWDSYDTVFIGYPIWWGIAAWPVDGFVSANDFTGKTVIPFCTSTSSGIGQSGDLLAELAGTGSWQPGMRFTGSATQAEVDEWVATLGL